VISRVWRQKEAHATKRDIVARVRLIVHHLAPLCGIAFSTEQDIYEAARALAAKYFVSGHTDQFQAGSQFVATPGALSTKQSETVRAKIRELFRLLNSAHICNFLMVAALRTPSDPSPHPRLRIFLEAKASLLLEDYGDVNDFLSALRWDDFVDFLTRFVHNLISRQVVRLPRVIPRVERPALEPLGS
jgi:hypothetical protein